MPPIIVHGNFVHGFFLSSIVKIIFRELVVFQEEWESFLDEKKKKVKKWEKK